MNALQFLASLRPAIPMSVERPCKPMSNGELRRHIQQGGVVINGERCKPDDAIGDVESLVFFQNSPNRRCTLV